MALINEDYLKLPENYLFSEINKKINVFKAMRPNSKVIHLDAGDSSAILKGKVAEALHRSIDELTDKSGGSLLSDIGELKKSLVSKILKTDYESRGVRLSHDEIFLSDNAKNTAEDINEIISRDNIVGILDPNYPAYIYSNVMNGRAGEKMSDGRWSNLVYIPCNWSNNFTPDFPQEKLDVIYLSLPNNPTGATLTFSELKKWVKYAIDNHALIIFDAAHEHYITEPDVPHSIYEIKGAKKVAVEIRSFSKTTGFTGSNFSFVIVPKEVAAFTMTGEAVSLNKIWQKRLTSKFSGIPYITLRTAEALYSPEGLAERKELAMYYMENAKFIREAVSKIGLRAHGGINSPYVWVKTPQGISSWKFFEQLLYKANIVCTPGVGFCPGGEGCVRFTGFCKREDVEEAMKRLIQFYSSVPL